jgi:hypothetical protein
MGRFLAGVASALLLSGAGIFVWKSVAQASDPVPAAPATAGAVGPVALDPLADPPRASEKTREERRFSRYDKDKDGNVAREEYLASRRKAYAKLDVNGDGRLTFDEWAAKTTTKFTTADGDRSGTLTPAEFATTRVIRKAATRPNCPPPPTRGDEEG